MVSAEAASRIDAMVKEAMSKGAALAAGGELMAPTVFTATVLDHVKPGMELYYEESFGPVVTVVRAKGVEDAIRIANDTDYGLSSAVFGRDISRAMQVAQRIEAGICHINGPTVQDEAQMPFGGVKGSGWGRFGGKAGVAEFTDLRWITIETEQHYPF
jgi:benzaldehyde dehydrogenase (NAD)